MVDLPKKFSGRKLYNEKGTLKKQALERYQAEWLRLKYRRDVSMPNALTMEHESDITGQKSKVMKQSTGMIDDFEALRPFLSERSRLADMKNLVFACHDQARLQAVKDLTALCGDTDMVLYRPGEIPVEGCCPVANCQKDLKEYVMFE